MTDTRHQVADHHRQISDGNEEEGTYMPSYLQTHHQILVCDTFEIFDIIVYIIFSILLNHINLCI